MKHLKTLIVALACLAVPALAVGQTVQTVSCDGCTHDLSVYMGEGGFIAEADDADMVSWVATCNNVTTSGELEPNDDGIVMSLLSDGNGLSCHDDDEDNRFQLGPVKDNGWFWITDGMNSAVGGLVNHDVLENDHKITPVSAGEGVTMMAGRGASYLKETATGRVGILPTVLPMPDVEPPKTNFCSYTTSGTAAAPVYTAETSKCMLGDGGSTLRVQGPPGFYTGRRTTIAANGRVTRPAGDATVTVVADLWGNGTGHYKNPTAVDARTGTDDRVGHPGGTALPLDATITASLRPGGVGSGQDIDTTGPDGEAGAGLTFAASAGVGTLTIAADPAYCDPTAKPPLTHSATVRFEATLTAAQKTEVIPTLTTTPAAAGVAARHTIVIMCPTGAAAHQGQELVPENPFPTDR